MKLMLKLTLLFLSLLSLSCSGPNDKGVEKTKKNFESPEKIGVLPDGREVFLVVRDRGIDAPHYIYFVGSSVTANTRAGKFNKVIPLIDGVEYIKKEGTETP